MFHLRPAIRTWKSYYHLSSAPAFLGAICQDKMSELLRPGRTRSNPDSGDDSLRPADKKPKLDASSDRVAQAGVALDPAHAMKNITSEKKPQIKGYRKRQKKLNRILPEPCSNEDVLWRDVISLLGTDTVDKALEDGTEWDSPLTFKVEVELTVSTLSSSGEALAIAPSHQRPWVVVVPFALPGEKILARIYRNSRLHSFADLIEVLTPNNELRDSSRIKCKYFGSCAGCQYQMLSYSVQLDLKRNVVVKAYQNFSGIPESSIPPIQPTIPSPLQYGYRTKITPHFEAPPKKLHQCGASSADSERKPEWLKIGFNRIGTRHVMDIEECPIATPVLNDAYGPIRADIIKNIFTYKKGVSLLLRDSLETPESEQKDKDVESSPTSPENTGGPPALAKHICITDHRATVREKVGDMLFEYSGGSFFQNNNSVLVPLTDYVRDAIFSPPALGSFPPPTHLVDAYCGSGLFAISLSPRFATIAGIELSSDSIKFATRNARLNNLSDGKCTFRTGDAADIFSTVADFPPDRTVLIIDPPRKGCDDNFLKQLLAFRCRTVVYVSCNVHTQARDVGIILKRTDCDGASWRGYYVLESLRGLDLFPQTAHVESVAVLRLLNI